MYERTLFLCPFISSQINALCSHAPWLTLIMWQWSKASSTFNAMQCLGQANLTSPI